LDPEYFPAELVEFDAYCLTRDVSRRPDTWMGYWDCCGKPKEFDHNLVGGLEHGLIFPYIGNNHPN
jgi:hypothetical protein